MGRPGACAVRTGNKVASLAPLNKHKHMTDYEYLAYHLKLAKSVIGEDQYEACMRILGRYPELDDPDTWVEFSE